MSNQVQKVNKNETAIESVKTLLKKDSYKRRIQELLNDRAEAFSTSIINISNIPSLKDADPNTVIASSIVAATLDLPIDQNLGFAYIVPYNNNKKINGKWVKKKEAQFQMGYKGYIQLALRSGQYKTINAIPVYKGEIERQNRLTGEVIFTENTSDIEYTDENVIGYAAYFRLTNGFEKVLYMTKKQVDDHARKYSSSYAYDLKENKKTSRWSVDFESMALKTVLKLLISKYGPLSVKMQEAIIKDQSVLHDENSPDYVDNAVEEEISNNANSEVIDADFEEVEETPEENKTTANKEEKPAQEKPADGQMMFDGFEEVEDPIVPF
jgi:hypothetical protein